MFESIFRNPSTIYVILRSTQEQGGFAAPKEMTVYYSRIQFGIRLSLLANIQEQYYNLQAANRGGDDGDKSYTQIME